MKINAQKMLVFLFSDESDSFAGNYQHLRYLFPDLSETGLRSVIYALKKEDLILVERSAKETSFILSPKGRVVLKKLFPVLGSQSSELGATSSCLVFGLAPSHDPHFRNLRQILLQRGFIPVNKGVYLSFQTIPSSVVELLTEKYFSAVYFFSIEKWLIENQFLLLQEKYQLYDIKESLSGISREIQALIENKYAFSQRNHQRNLKIFSVYDRIFLLIQRRELGLMPVNETSTDAARLIFEFHTLF